MRIKWGILDRCIFLEYSRGSEHHAPLCQSGYPKPLGFRVSLIFLWLAGLLSHPFLDDTITMCHHWIEGVSSNIPKQSSSSSVHQAPSIWIDKKVAMSSPHREFRRVPWSHSKEMICLPMVDTVNTCSFFYFSTWVSPNGEIFQSTFWGLPWWSSSG